jgi:hypothetical protein
VRLAWPSDTKQAKLCIEATPVYPALRTSTVNGCPFSPDLGVAEHRLNTTSGIRNRTCRRGRHERCGGSGVHPDAPARRLRAFPGHVVSVSVGVNALRANIGSEQGHENHQPPADEDQACDDVGSPMHTQLNP